MTDTFGYYSIPALVCSFALILLLAATPLLRVVDAPPTAAGNRIVTLDGLRGFLALGVFFHHAAVYHRYVTNLPWDIPPSPVFAALGPLGVSMFFMITGYLFWGRLLRNAGRADWRALLTGRLFRIAPLYLLAILVLILLVFISTGPHLREAPRTLVHQLLLFLSLGLFQGQDLNTYHHADLLLAGVTWTIQFEWCFYLVLPLIAWFSRKSRVGLTFVLSVLFLVTLARVLHPSGFLMIKIIPCTQLFAVGMLCASAAWRVPAHSWKNHAASVLALGCVLAEVTRKLPPAWSHLNLLLLGTTFFLITSGCSLFGLLRSRPARRLGDISYGMYLLQGLALDMFFRVPVFRRLAATSPLHHWELTLASAILLVAMATLTYRFVEKPCIALGRQVIRRLHLQTA